MTETGEPARSATIGIEGAAHHVAVLGGEAERALASIVETGAASLTLCQREGTPDAGRRFEGLGLDIRTHRVDGPWPLPPLLRLVDARREAAENGTVLVNIAGADRQGASAGTVAGYIRDLPVLDVVEGSPIVLPRLRFTYEETVSETKLSILEALDEADGCVDRLQELARRAGIEPSLASYHVRGGRDVSGLEELGLVSIEGGTVGQLSIQLTDMGALLARRLLRLNSR